MSENEIRTPAVLLESSRLERNLGTMQRLCDQAGTELWPHVKTHKLVPILQRQLALGASGATCAKIGEAEALLPSGVRRVFIAHSLIDPAHAPRLAALQARLDELMLAVTSEVHFAALDALLEAAGLSVPVLLAVDTGLGREGTRSPGATRTLAQAIRRSARMDLRGLYTHEGHAYGIHSPAEAEALAADVHRILLEHAAAAGGDLSLWPGCSVTAPFLAGRERIQAVRPGSYALGDLFLTETTRVSPPEAAALTILATVVDRPQSGLALIDAGSKVFSSDKTSDGLSARAEGRSGLEVRRLSEEHGFVTGSGVDELRIGDQLSFIPAHVCPVVNLAEFVHLVDGGRKLATWKVDARGRSD